MKLTLVGSLLSATMFTGCGARGNEASSPAPAQIAPILLFNGTGSSDGDVAALEKILHSEHLSYSTVESPSLNRMSASQIRKYRLLIVPRGNFVDIGNS